MSEKSVTEDCKCPSCEGPVMTRYDAMAEANEVAALPVEPLEEPEVLGHGGGGGGGEY